MSDRDQRDEDTPPSPEELARAAELRDALARDELVLALRAAWSPGPLDEGVHAEMLDDLPSPAELALAAKLRDGLEHDALGSALRAAWTPRDLSSGEHRAIVARALGTEAPSHAVAGTPESKDARPRANVVSLAARRRVIAVATTAITLAACLVLWLRRPSEQEPLARVRSTQSLFGEPFKSGEASARIDRIALARSSDYRDNRFAQWGVR